MNNIELFDVVSGNILAKLYEAFPKKIIFDCESLCENEFFMGMDKNEKITFCRDTLDFLSDNNILTYSKSSLNGLFSQVRLSANGLAILKKPMPTVLNKKETIGQRLKSAFSDGVDDVAIDVAKTVIMKLFT